MNHDELLWSYGIRSPNNLKWVVGGSYHILVGPLLVGNFPDKKN